MRLRHGLLALTFLLAGCGTLQSLPSAPYGHGFAAFDDAPIFNLPGVKVGVSMPLSGDYQSIHITGTGQLDALDATHMAMSATASAHIVFITETKQLTMNVTKTQSAQWPYGITAVNVTDHKTYTHQAKLQSQTPDGLTSTFVLDDGSSAQIAADGKGDFKVVYGDFTLIVGQEPNNLMLRGPRVMNRPSKEHFFSF